MPDAAPTAPLEETSPRRRRTARAPRAAPPRASEESADTPAVPAATPSPESKPTAKKRSDEKETEESTVPKRAPLAPGAASHLRLRARLARRRPVFGRQAANRYWRIGRDQSWRRPRGLQSKQRRHYGYRPRLVRIGYGSPADVRGLTPSGYRPVLVHHPDELKALDPKRDAAVIARTVGTRRRLGLEDAARKLGIRVLNPLATPGEE
jgi:large subunit ribosomal protein L32e